MQKIRIFEKNMTIPAPFRQNKELGTAHYKIKVPKKSKLLEKGITKAQFCQEVADSFEQEYELNGMLHMNSSDWRMQRGYMFMCVTGRLDV